MGSIKQLLIEMEETFSQYCYSEMINPTPIEDEPVNEEKHENEKMDVLSPK
jgi:hypothetical protein